MSTAKESKLTDKQIKRLENLQYGMMRNKISASELAQHLTDYHYSSVLGWTQGKNLQRKADERLDLLEAAYAKCLGLNVQAISKRDTTHPDAQDEFKLDVPKLKEAMDAVGFSVQQLIFLVKGEGITEECMAEETTVVPKATMKKLEKLFDKPKQYFVYVEPEPVVEEAEPQETAEPNPEMEYQLTKCQEELASIRADVAEMKVKWLNLVKLFNDVEDSNSAIFKLVKEIHYDLIGSYQEDAMHNTEYVEQAGI